MAERTMREPRDSPGSAVSSFGQVSYFGKAAGILCKAWGEATVRRAALVLAPLVLIVALLGLPNLTTGTREGEIAFSPESVDLGRIPLGKKAPFRYEMRNTGNKPVRIVGARIEALEGC